MDKKSYFEIEDILHELLGDSAPDTTEFICKLVDFVDRLEKRAASEMAVSA